MSLDSSPIHFQLLTFAIPGLPEVQLAISLAEVLESVQFAAVTPVPFAPSALMGIAEWQNRVITVLNLAQALRPGLVMPHTGYWRYLVARVVFEREIDYLAWPILPGARLLPAPVLAPQADPPGMLNPALLRTSILLDNSPVLLLDLEQVAGQLGAENKRASA